MTTQRRKFVGFTLAVGLMASAMVFSAVGVAPRPVEPPPVQQLRLEAAEFELESFDVDQSLSFIQQETVRRGETLAALSTRLGIEDREFQHFVRNDPIGRKLLQLRAGRTVSAHVLPDGQVQRLTYRVSTGGQNDLGERLVIFRAEGRWHAHEEPVPIEKSIEVRSIEIQSSLIAALDSADIPDNAVTRIADIFGGDLDFHRMHRGDRLRVVYESLREAGSLEPPVVGRILASEYRSGTRRLEAVWFQRDNGRAEYFDFKGRSLTRSYLPSPLEFSRISSGFSPSRRHPISREWRSHRGVDYAAPVGTPVRTVADGSIEFIGWQTGYGKVIVVRHDPRHSTLYAHLSAFSDGLRPGASVRQGEVIGRVGMTGWATGPHLHFEFHVNRRQVEPLAALRQQPSPRPLSAADSRRLQGIAQSYAARFELLDTQLAARFQ